MIKSHSLLSASLDDLGETTNQTYSLDSTSELDTNDHVKTNGNRDQEGTEHEEARLEHQKSSVFESREPRTFDEETESLGVSQILNALSEEEIANMPDANLPLRHFRADKGNIQRAIVRTKYAIQWRQEFGVENIIKAIHDPIATKADPELQRIRDIIKHEASPGKMYVRNHDKEGRAILYMYPVRENTNHPVHNIMHLVYAIERAIAATEKNGFEKIVIIMDFENWSLKHAAPMETTKKTIHILQECYVERMSRVYFTNAPIMFRTFWNMAKPFVDPVTKKKIVFCSSKAGKEELKKNFDEKKVEKCGLGTNKNLRPFDVDEYFSTPLHISFDESCTS
jgi:hypothetical protein